ncbi:secreted RxLR effector protein 161-like [Nicotiana sylvestris]|uniref:secreted RxLR effector protein 161-like n=1 Tax=Nicotiana sylvestris TaxID=4096 RepID=UPI00388C9C7D
MISVFLLLPTLSRGSGIGLCAGFQENPKESYLTDVKRILRYLKGTTDLGHWYPKGSNFNLVGYADVDYVGFLVDRKSTSGMADFLGSCLVSWATKKQNSVALSTVEAEYVAAASCCAQLLWIKQ